MIRPGSPFATPEAELVKLPGFSKDIKKSRAEAKQAARRSRRAEPEVHAAEPQPRAALHAGRHLPGRPVAADRRRRSSTSSPTPAPYLADHEQPATTTWRSTSPTCSWTIPSLGLAKYLSVDRAPENRSRSKDRRARQALRRRTCANAIRRSARRMIQAFEKRLFEQAYQQPLLWWHRIVPTHKTRDGLEDVAEPQPRPGPRRRLAEQ